MGRLGSHQHIVTVFDFGEHQGQPYIVAELMGGGDVESLIERSPDHWLPLDQAIDIAKSVCLGLEFAHSQGVIHRGLKPSNIYLTEGGTAKLGDLGLALAVNLPRLTRSGMMVGTVSYMPPEQAMGGEVTPRADLYSLGAMLYEMVTGRPPFPGEDPVAIIGQHINTPPVSPTWHRADVSPALEALIMHLLEKDPQRRPASATDVRKALEEAKGAAVVEERSAMGGAVSYRFAHAFFRQTLYEEIIAPRRIRLHQQVAQALEGVYAARLEEHATELAEHFSYSPDLADLGKAVSYGEMAAQRAMDVYAFGEAVRLLEQALKVQEVLNSDDKGKKCDLLLALGDAVLYAGEPRRVLDVEASQALSLAEAMGDSRRASQVCYLATRALFRYGLWRAFATPEGVQWTERADRYAEPDTVERAWADIALGQMKWTMGELGEGIALLRQALELARSLGDPETLCWAGCYWVNLATAPQHLEGRLRVAEELDVARRAGVTIDAVLWSLGMIGHVFLEAGQRRLGEEAWMESRSLAERTGVPTQLLASMWLDITLAILDGHLEEAAEIIQHMLTRADELGLSEFAGSLGVCLSNHPT